MPKFIVQVERSAWETKRIELEADDEEDANSIVQEAIDAGKIYEVAFCDKFEFAGVKMECVETDCSPDDESVLEVTDVYEKDPQ